LALSRNFPDKLVQACDSTIADSAAEENQSVLAGNPREKALQESADRLVWDLKKQSPFDTLIGRLGAIFEKHFKMPAQISRPKDEKDDTPFMRFARAVLKEFGLSYSDEAIIKAASVARAGRGRRKVSR
jgi:hypothetical protein